MTSTPTQSSIETNGTATTGLGSNTRRDPCARSNNWSPHWGLQGVLGTLKDSRTLRATWGSSLVVSVSNATIPRSRITWDKTKASASVLISMYGRREGNFGMWHHQSIDVDSSAI